MKKLLFYLLFACASSLLFAQKANNIHKTGLYKYKDPNFDGFYIKRTKNKQVEYNKAKKFKIVLTVKWSSDTEYILTMKNDKGNVGCLKKGDAVEVFITESDTHNYTCSYTTLNCGSGTTSFLKVK